MSLKSIVTFALALSTLSVTPSVPAASTTQPQGRTSVLILHGATLANAIDSLQQISTRKIFVNWSGLAQAGIKRDLPVTVDLSDRSFDDALAKLLNHVGGTHVSLGYRLDEGPDRRVHIRPIWQ